MEGLFFYLLCGVVTFAFIKEEKSWKELLRKGLGWPYFLVNYAIELYDEHQKNKEEKQ